MQSKKFTEFRVGLFVTIGLVLAMLIIFMIGGEHKLFERYFTVYANFSGIAGLRIGAPVQLAGLKVGFVDKIRFPADLARNEITVTLRIKKAFQERVRQDSVATIETQGLLGDKYVYIAMGSESQPVMPDKGIIASKETTSIFALAERAGAIMDNIAKASDSISEMLGSVHGKKGDGDIKAMITSVRKSIEQIEKGKGLAHALIYDPNGEKTITDLSEALKSVRDITASANKGIKENEGGMIVNLRQASIDLRNILGNIRRGEGTIGKLINDPALYDDLRALAGRVNRNNLLKAVIRSTLNENDRQTVQ